MSAAREDEITGPELVERTSELTDEWNKQREREMKKVVPPVIKQRSGSVISSRKMIPFNQTSAKNELQP